MNNKSHSVPGKENTFALPGTPDLKKIGYGTGVAVFHISPRNGNFSSPWALKKLMRGNKSNQKIMGERLRNEAEVLKKLNHPNIVGFRAFSCTSDGRGCLAMEECHTSLGDLIEQKDVPFPVQIASKVAFEIAKALDYIHNMVLLLHGDIKSHNILIKGNFDAVKLCDFGVSLPLTADGHLDRKAAGKNATYVGTELWSAPEVISTKTSPIIITDKADVFSYGLTIWEMMTLSPPHSENVFNESEESFDEEMLDELIGTCPDVPKAVLNISGYRTLVSLFSQCCIEDYLQRLSAKDIIKFCNENNIR